MKREQKIYVVFRSGGYLMKSGGWTSDVRLAAMWPEKQARSKVKIDVGMPCELVEVFPQAVPKAERISV